VSGRSVIAGGLCGLAAGVVSGVVLQLLWALAPFALLLARPPGTTEGWVVHLAMTAVWGMAFGITADALHLTRRGLLIAGMLLGAAFFLAGPVLLVPAVTGLPLQSPFLLRWLKIGAVYLAFGALAGVMYTAARDRLFERRV